MTVGRLVVVDWTSSVARIGVFSRNSRGWQMTSELDVSSRLVVRNEPPDGLVVLAGMEAAESIEDVNTLVVEHPVDHLARMEDPELASLLFDGFWLGVSEALLDGDHLHAGDLAAGYLVTSQRFPRPLLESLRATGAKRHSPKLIGSIHEAAALVVGSFRAGVYQQESAPRAGQTVCLVVACDERTIDVACFDYTQVAHTHQRILIRDCFQTTCGDLSKRLHDCDWLGAFSVLVIVEDTALPASASAAIDAPLLAIADTAMVRRQRLAAAFRLKLMGGAHIAMCAARDAPDDHEYDIAHACHVGLQIDQQHFQPLVNKYAWTHLDELPYVAAQAFQLRGKPGNALRLNFYSGYSTRVADAVPLGHAMLWQEDLAQLNRTNSLTAVVRLDGPGSGEFLVGVMPDNRLLRRQAFTLPGLMV